MKKSRLSFRGRRIGLIGCGEQDAATLARQLARLGAVSVALGAVTPTELEGDLALAAVFVDAESDGAEQSVPEDLGALLPVVALVGSETPSALNRIARLSVSAHLMKPVRSFGVMAALCFAREAFATRRRLEDRIERLENRAKWRRFVVAAQLGLMKDHGLSEAAAFERLRGAAMEHRTTIEAISVDLVAGSVRLAPPDHRGRNRRVVSQLEGDGD